MAGKFQGTDFYDVDSLLSEEERMIRDTARSYAQDRLAPRVRAAFRDESAICEWGCEIAADIASLPIGSRRHLHRQPPLLESPRNEGCRPQFG